VLKKPKETKLRREAPQLSFLGFDVLLSSQRKIRRCGAVRRNDNFLGLMSYIKKPTKAQYDSAGKARRIILGFCCNLYFVAIF